MHPAEREALDVILEIALALKSSIENQADKEPSQILDLPPSLINSTILYNLSTAVIRLYELSLKPVKQQLNNLH